MKSKKEKMIKCDLIEQYRYYTVGILNAVDESLCEKVFYCYENADPNSLDFIWAHKLLNRISRKIDDAIASERDNFIV